MAVLMTGSENRISICMIQSVNVIVSENFRWKTTVQLCLRRENEESACNIDNDYRFRTADLQSFLSHPVKSLIHHPIIISKLM